MKRFGVSIALILISLFPVLIGIGAGALAQADECPTIRLDQGSGSMAGIPVKDQGDLGICYSYAASSLFDAWAKSRLKEGARPPHTTSPLYASVLFKLGSKNLSCPDLKENGDLEPIVNGGQTCETLAAIAGAGSCSEEALEAYFRAKTGPNPAIAELKGKIKEAEKRLERTRESLTRFKTKTSYSAQQREKLLKGFQESVRSEEADLKKLRANLASAEHKPYTSRKEAFETVYTEAWLESHCSAEARPRGECKSCKSGGTGTESVESAMQKELIDQMARLTLQDLKRDLDKGACDQNHWKLPATSCAPSCTKTPIPPPENQNGNLNTAKITTALQSPKSLPVEISFCGAIIGSDEQKRVWSEKEKIALPANGSWLKHPKCGAHAVLIIGQQLNPATGACQYRLRNSWGAECGAQSICKNRQCKCDEGTGDVLIDRDLLMKNTFGISTISDRGTCR